MSAVGRAAAAILAKVPVGYGMRQDEAEEYARAAIASLREPTPEMVIAVRLAVPMTNPDAARACRAMIDAALSEASQPKGGE